MFIDLEVSMKTTLILVTLLMTQMVFAETLRDRKIKEEMLTRVDSLIQKVEAGQTSLKTEDMARTCDTIEELFKALPDHLVAIGTKMDLLKGKIIKMENETKLLLIDMHMRSNICNVGERGENLDIKETEKQFKKMLKGLKKQKKIISKSETNFENSYQYHYEF